MPKQIDHYKIIAELGIGGMGKVYKAHDSYTNRTVAIKVIHPDSISEKAKKRFFTEAKIMAKFKHHNIVAIYNIATETATNMDYIVMDFVEGKNLSGKNLSGREALRILRDVAFALDYAHQQKIIHRDLKPANIMLTKDRQPVVMDFGLAKDTQGEDITQTDTVMGTPRYMAPEQVQGKIKDICPQTDVYALGAILYELLAGKPAIEGQTAPQIMFNILHKEPIPLKKHNSKLAFELEVICAKAMSKGIKDRYLSAKDFAQDIHRFLCGELIQAQPYTFLQKTWRKIKKNKFTMAIIIASVFLTFLALWLFEKRGNINTYLYLKKAKEWKQKAENIKGKNNQIKAYIKASDFLEKALEISPGDLSVKSKLIAVLEKIGFLTRVQKNYLLSYAFIRQSKNLGSKHADKLLASLEKEENQLKQKHTSLINKIMTKTSKNASAALSDYYTFTIAKIQKPYVVGVLVPYLERANKWQKLLAIKVLGKLGNNYTKFKDKDSVEWLLYHLAKFKDKEAIEKKQKEVEQIIWALGWLKDERANKLVYKIRYLAKSNSLWISTRVAYSWIPLEKKFLPKNAQQFLTRANMKQQKGDYKGAIDDYTHSVLLDPKFLKAYLCRGRVYVHLKEHPKAIADYNHAISLNPKNSEAFQGRGTAYTGLKKHQKAIADYNQAISLNPKNSFAYNSRGTAYTGLKEHPKAIDDYSQAISLNTTNLKAHLNRGILYFKTKKYQKAFQDFQAFLQLAPDHPKAPQIRVLIDHLKVKNMVK